MKLRLFKIFFSIDALICAIFIIFFFVGLADGSVSSFNIEIWVIILIVLAVIISGGLWIKNLGYPAAGIIILLVLAVPGLLYVVFMFLIFISDTSWN